MINRNTSLNYNTKNRAFQKEMPFLLKPAGKDYLWGGQRLRADFGKESVLNPPLIALGSDPGKKR